MDKFYVRFDVAFGDNKAANSSAQAFMDAAGLKGTPLRGTVEVQANEVPKTLPHLYKLEEPPRILRVSYEELTVQEYEKLWRKAEYALWGKDEVAASPESAISRG